MKTVRVLNIIFSTVLLLMSCGQKKPSGKTSDRINFLFILADDFGYSDMSVMGSTFYETPNIDRIAKEGMIFTDGYAAAQVCSPSRASILSGRFTARHGITDWIGAPAGEAWRSMGRHNQLLPPDYVRALPQEYITLPEAMKEAGYRTFFAGKWHLGGRDSWPENHGFDINRGGWDVGSPNGGYYSPWKNPNLENVEDGENLTMRLAKETVKFLQENRDTAFFAYLSFYAVHAPLETTHEKWAKYRQKAQDAGIADTGFKMGHFLPIRQVQDNPVYAGLVESMDDAVGCVLKALDDLGLAENTVVIFTSDNGGVAAGDAFSTSNLPLRAGKGYQFEGGIREPFFIKVPNMGGGQKCSTPVIATDFYPTILDLAGAELRPEEHIDGKSLLPLLKGDTLSERPLVWHYPHYGNQGGEPSSIIREGDWKLIHYYEDGRNELYNLKNDLGEQHDLAQSEAERVGIMCDKLIGMLTKMGASYPTPDSEWTAEAEATYLKGVVEKRLPQLEKQRMSMLSESYDPNNNWWGSEPTKD
ncbi:MAG: sulfatase [Bacteroidales bacterium]